MKNAPSARIMQFPEPPVKPRKTRPVRSCRLCHQSGHDARKCPNHDQLVEEERAGADARERRVRAARSTIGLVLAELPPASWERVLRGAAEDAALRSGGRPGAELPALRDVRRLAGRLAELERQASRPRAPWLPQRARA